MNEELLFELLSDIDDAYILEARQELSEEITAPKKASTGKIRKIVFYTAIGIAALAIAIFGGRACWMKSQHKAKNQGTRMTVEETCEMTTMETCKTQSSGDFTFDVVSSETAKISYTVSMPSDRKVQVNGSFRPAFLRIDLTNQGDVPILYENSFYLQNEKDGQWYNACTLADNTYSEKERTLAPGESITRHLEIPYEMMDFPEGKYRLLITVTPADPSSSEEKDGYVVGSVFDIE